jgi:hypothetical protein
MYWVQVCSHDGNTRNMTVTDRRVDAGARAQTGCCNTDKKYINEQGATQVTRCKSKVGSDDGTELYPNQRSIREGSGV